MPDVEDSPVKMDNLEIELGSMKVPSAADAMTKVGDAKTPQGSIVKDVKVPSAADAMPKVEEAKTPQGSIFRFASTTDRLMLALGTFVAFVSGCSQPAQLIVFGNIINAFNDASKSEAVDTVELLALLYFLIGLGTFAVNFLQTAIFTRVAVNITQKIRENYYKALIHQDISFFDREDQGSLSVSVVETSIVIQDGLGEKLGLAIQFTSSFFLGIGVGLYFSWQLALVLCAILPVMVTLIGLATKAIQKSNKRSTQAYNSAGGYATEILSAIRTVASLGFEDVTILKYEDLLKVTEKAGIAAGMGRGMQDGMVGFVMMSMYGVGLWFGSKLISDQLQNRDECSFVFGTDPVTGASVLLEVPDDSCIQGGDVMIVSSTCLSSRLFTYLPLHLLCPEKYSTLIALCLSVTALSLSVSTVCLKFDFFYTTTPSYLFTPQSSLPVFLFDFVRGHEPWPRQSWHREFQEGVQNRERYLQDRRSRASH
jgi:ABC-type multidrug transport system fused ATPase/permease subunit